MKFFIIGSYDEVLERIVGLKRKQLSAINVSEDHSDNIIRLHEIDGIEYVIVPLRLLQEAFSFIDVTADSFLDACNDVKAETGQFPIIEVTT